MCRYIYQKLKYNNQTSVSQKSDHFNKAIIKETTRLSYLLSGVCPPITQFLPLRVTSLTKHSSPYFYSLDKEKENFITITNNV